MGKERRIKQEPLTVNELNEFPGLENLSEDDSKNYLDSLDLLATIVIEHIIRMEHQQDDHLNKRKAA